MRTKAIKGVSTGIAAFIGPAHGGPVGVASKTVTSLAGFERIYGGGDPLQFNTSDGVALPPIINYLWHAARVFFAQGGRRLYIVRVHKPMSDESEDDGQPPTALEYDCLTAIETIDDISLVAAPALDACADPDDRFAVRNQLVAHAVKMRYRIGILDSERRQSVAAVRQLRTAFDSSQAALYYPWLKVNDPISGGDIFLPPSAFVAGIYAGSDFSGGFAPAVAKVPVPLAAGVEQILKADQQDALNRAGINCFRAFPGQGVRLWGSRTLSADPDYQYVPVRRYVNYLEHSIDQGTQFAVFEPNDEPLWAKVRRAVGNFMNREWQSGALQGTKPDAAYFVRCDRSTMTQDDLDNGRLVCEIGVALLRPAEFVIFRIGQWTADHKD